MAAYPLTSWSSDSRRSPQESRALHIGRDGTLGSKDLFSGISFDVLLVHDLVTEATATTVESFYKNDPFQVVEFTWEDDAMSGLWRMRPAVKHIRGDRWRIESRFVAILGQLGATP